MLKQQTLPFTEDISTCLQVDSPVSHSLKQAKERAQMITATYGQRCCERLEKLRHVGSWVKMFSALLIGRTEWYSSRCNLIWKMKGTKSNRLLFLLAPSMPPIAEIGCGLLPTVVTQGLKYCNERGQSAFVDLSLLPTPDATEGHKYTKTLNLKSQRGRSLTALAVNGFLPTPSARDWKGRTNPGVKKQGCGNIYGETLPDATYRIFQNSQLNPLYVAEMMGFPIDWTLSPFQRGGENQSKPTATP